MWSVLAGQAVVCHTGAIQPAAVSRREHAESNLFGSPQQPRQVHSAHPRKATMALLLAINSMASAGTEAKAGQSADTSTLHHSLVVSKVAGVARTSALNPATHVSWWRCRTGSGWRWRPCCWSLPSRSPAMLPAGCRSPLSSCRQPCLEGAPAGGSLVTHGPGKLCAAACSAAQQSRHVSPAPD